MEESELREVAGDVRRDIESHRGPVTPDNVARLALGRLRWYRFSLRSLYRERTPVLEDRSEAAVGVVKKRRNDSRRPGERPLEPFNRQKLLTSVELVVHRRVDKDAIERLVNSIEHHVRVSDGPVSTSQIRRWVAEGLRPLDPFAYLRVLSTAPDADLESLRKTAEEIQHGLVRKRERGRFEQFSRAKLSAVVKRAVAGRDKVSEADIETFVDEIGEQVRAQVQPVESDQIGQWVLAWLRQRDPVGFVSFLALQPLDSPSDLARALRGEWGGSPPEP